ncbi:hypothetical protein [Aedoeadaptatus coli]|nr:hypothetical protein [Peptoniphilus coli]
MAKYSDELKKIVEKGNGDDNNDRIKENLGGLSPKQCLERMISA